MAPSEPQGRSSDTRERILAAAAEVFAEHGFAGTAVDEIARRAGVNKAMLYYHVGDKQALYTTVMERNIDRAREIIEAAVERAGDPVERLTAMLRALTTVVQEAPAYHRLVLREMASGGAHLEEPVLLRFAAVFGLTRRVMEEGRAAGVFRDLNPFLTHLLLVGSVIATAAQPLRHRLIEAGLIPPELQRLVPADPTAFLADVIMNGIRAPAGGGMTS